MSDKPASSSPAAIQSSEPAAPKLPPLRPFYRELASLSGKQRLDRILSRKDTMRVVRQMPVLDLYATVKDVGVEDALEVIELMSPAQIQGFMDLDGWRRDRIDPTAMGRWLRAMFAANVERAVGQLRGLDIELLTLLVKIHCTVYDLIAEEQPEEEVGRHSITPDQRYLIVYGGVGGDDDVQATLQQALERMMARDMLFVLRLCESVRWELPSSLEEEALHWRHGRLADLGFLPQDDAATIYAFLDPTTLSAAVAHDPLPVHEETTSADLTTSVLLPWELLRDGSSVLGSVLRHLPQAGRDRVTLELMLTTNRVHAADAADLGDSDALKEAARRVAQTVGIGAAFVSGGDETKLVQVVQSHSVSELFRVGHSLTLKVRDEVRIRIRTPGSGLDGRGLLRLDAPLREVVAGLMRPRPLLFGGLVDPNRVDYRAMSSLAELAAITRAVSEASFRAALLHRLGANDGAFVDIDDADLPSHGAILGGLLVRAALHPTSAKSDPSPIRALSDVELSAAHAAIHRDADAFITAGTLAILAATDAMASPSGPDDDEARRATRARIAAYVDVVAAAVRADLGVDAMEFRAIGSVWHNAV